MQQISWTTRDGTTTAVAVALTVHQLQLVEARLRTLERAGAVKEWSHTAVEAVNFGELLSRLGRVR